MKLFTEENLAPVFKDGWGFINKKGDWVIKPKYSEAHNFIDGKARVVLDDKMIFIDTKGKVLKTTEFDLNFTASCGLIAKEEKEKTGFVNDKGIFVIKPIFYAVKPFVNCIAAVVVDGKWGFIRKK